MKTILENYLEAKKILEIASDTNNPSNHFVRANLTLEQASKLQEFIKTMEDQGAHLINKNRN